MHSLWQVSCYHVSAVQRWPPGRQMRPINETGNPYLHLEWSVLQLINFRRNFRSLTTYVVCKNTPIALKFDGQLGTTGSGPPIKFQNDWRNLNINPVRPRRDLRIQALVMVENKRHRSHIRVLSSFLTTAYTDHPKVIRATQPSTMGGPLGDPRLWTALSRWSWLMLMKGLILLKCHTSHFQSVNAVGGYDRPVQKVMERQKHLFSEAKVKVIA